MLKFKKRLDETLQLFKNKNTVLGYRKLLDCVIDTQDLSLFNEAISLTNWKETEKPSSEALISKSILLLEKLNTIEVKQKNVSNIILKCDNIYKSYGKDRFKLGPISLNISKGQVYGLVGENGNGKTTLLRILAKDLSLTQGNLTYTFDNNPKDSFELRSKLVYIPQRTQKWYGSLLDNLKFVLSNYNIPAQEIETRVLMMVARFGLWNYKHLKWHQLSSGYKMRFELARTLLRQPELLLLDEPLANLDILSQQVILEDLRSICNSASNPIALILSSQQLYEVEKISDKVIFLKNGKYSDNETLNTISKDQELTIEIDCKDSQAELENAVYGLKLNSITYNGGVFILKFNTPTTYSNVLEQLGKNNIEVIYTRNISQSTRRFFVS